MQKNDDKTKGSADIIYLKKSRKTSAKKTEDSAELYEEIHKLLQELPTAGDFKARQKRAREIRRSKSKPTSNQP